MVDVGILDKDDKCELLRGIIVTMSPQGDAVERTVDVFTEPAEGGYRQHVVMRDGDVLRPTQLPDVEIAVADLPR